MSSRQDYQPLEQKQKHQKNNQNNTEPDINADDQLHQDKIKHPLPGSPISAQLSNFKLTELKNIQAYFNHFIDVQTNRNKGSLNNGQINGFEIQGSVNVDLLTQLTEIMQATGNCFQSLQTANNPNSDFLDTNCFHSAFPYQKFHQILKKFQFKQKSLIQNQLLKSKRFKRASSFTDTFLIHQTHPSKHYQIVKLQIQLLSYTTEITILNVLGANSLLTAGPIAASGTFGSIYFVNTHHDQLAIKCIQLPVEEKLDKQESNILQIKRIVSTMTEYFFILMFSELQIGPKSKTIGGFDLVVYEDSLMFATEICSMLNQNQKYTHQITRSLFKMHMLQVVHRDIKPTNILYSPTFKKEVFIDFGCTQPIKQIIGQKTLSRFKGTTAYCNEEVLNLLKKKTSMVDLYSNDLYGLDKYILTEKDQKPLFEENKNNQIVNAMFSVLKVKHCLYHEDYEGLIDEWKLLGKLYYDQIQQIQIEIMRFFYDLRGITHQLAQFYWSSIGQNAKDMAQFIQLNTMFKRLKNVYFLTDLTQCSQKQKNFRIYKDLYKEIQIQYGDYTVEQRQVERILANKQNVENYLISVEGKIFEKKKCKIQVSDLEGNLTDINDNDKGQGYESYVEERQVFQLSVVVGRYCSMGQNKYNASIKKKIKACQLALDIMKLNHDYISAQFRQFTPIFTLQHNKHFQPIVIFYQFYLLSVIPKLALKYKSQQTISCLVTLILLGFPHYNESVKSYFLSRIIENFHSPFQYQQQKKKISYKKNQQQKDQLKKINRQQQMKQYLGKLTVMWEFYLCILVHYDSMFGNMGNIRIVPQIQNQFMSKRIKKNTKIKEKKLLERSTYEQQKCEWPKKYRFQTDIKSQHIHFEDIISPLLFPTPIETISSNVSLIQDPIKTQFPVPFNVHFHRRLVSLNQIVYQKLIIHYKSHNQPTNNELYNQITSLSISSSQILEQSVLGPLYRKLINLLFIYLCVFSSIMGIRGSKPIILIIMGRNHSEILGKDLKLSGGFAIKLFRLQIFHHFFRILNTKPHHNYLNKLDEIIGNSEISPKLELFLRLKSSLQKKDTHTIRLISNCIYNEINDKPLVMDTITSFVNILQVTYNYFVLNYFQETPAFNNQSYQMLKAFYPIILLFLTVGYAYIYEMKNTRFFYKIEVEELTEKGILDVLNNSQVVRVFYFYLVKLTEVYCRGPALVNKMLNTDFELIPFEPKLIDMVKHVLQQQIVFNYEKMWYTQIEKNQKIKQVIKNSPYLKQSFLSISIYSRKLQSQLPQNQLFIEDICQIDAKASYTTEQLYKKIPNFQIAIDYIQQKILASKYSHEECRQLIELYDLCKTHQDFDIIFQKKQFIRMLFVCHVYTMRQDNDIVKIIEFLSQITKVLKNFPTELNVKSFCNQLNACLWCTCTDCFPKQTTFWKHSVFSNQLIQFVKNEKQPNNNPYMAIVCTYCLLSKQQEQKAAPKKLVMYILRSMPFLIKHVYEIIVSHVYNLVFKAFHLEQRRKYLEGIGITQFPSNKTMRFPKSQMLLRTHRKFIYFFTMRGKYQLNRQTKLEQFITLRLFRELYYEGYQYDKKVRDHYIVKLKRYYEVKQNYQHSKDMGELGAIQDRQKLMSF